MTNKIGRNELCPCKSGKKYKKCCLGKMNSKNIQQEKLISVLRGPIQAGKDNDLLGRFVFGLNPISDFCIASDKRKEYSKDYDDFFQNLLETQITKDFYINTLKNHQNSIEKRNPEVIEITKEGQVNILKPIDNELNIFFKDFFIRGAMTVEGLRKLINKWYGYDIKFLFVDDDKEFEKGANSFKLDKNDPRFVVLADFIKNHRDGWYRSFKKLREDITHRGFKLPQVSYTYDSSGKLVASINIAINPPQELEKLLDMSWINLSTLCEEILVFIMSLELKQSGGMSYAIMRIPEEEREKYFWARYRVFSPEFPEAHVSTS